MMPRHVMLAAALVAAVAPTRARADDDPDDDLIGDETPFGKHPRQHVSVEAWDVTRGWLIAAQAHRGKALRGLSPGGLAVRIHVAEETRLSRACRRLDGKTLRTRAQLTRLARCVSAHLPGDLRADPPTLEDTGGAPIYAAGEVPPSIEWGIDSDCGGDHATFVVAEREGRPIVTAVTIYVDDCVEP